ncbi:Uncharacterised protein [Yersinia enterocolitica]|nr:Uncharacterised protein [Yersinia enterocolitica]
MIGGGDRVRLLEWLELLFRLLFVQLSLYLRCLNRAGGQAGPPAPAACAKYCPAGKPPASLGLTSQRDGHPCPSALFAGVHARLLYPSVLVGNIPDCAQRQKKKLKPAFRF